ncbi:PX domain-containing protein kinase-like protein [Scaptodrosophila lebanonensis]|uniref:PX domain-containing protein kinase-like protein n=1 Tax=Drosophila lebanonensis TaxID=7225 RepID=A0A6J2TB99_DROLE|nr:PX domain-containing protein kinase-like protein [Scaptodrosophila lebanonensis]XP_030372648.1 PX domain-containing protein kinase-like protein [Scaptodrosophila lebanonensis]
MAIFARKYERKLPIDDTETLSCEIVTVEEVNGHTEYLLRVQRGPNQENSWKVLRRYNDFYKLHQKLGAPGALPKKRFFGNMRPDFIAERKEALQIYINTVLMNPILASSLPAKRFVDPENYAQSFHDHAMQNALLCLRNDSVWALGATLGPIGWRLRKHYFKVTTKPPEKTHNKLLVKSGSQTHQSKHFAAGSSNGSGGSIDAGTFDPNTEMVAEWLEYGPDKYIEEKEMNGVLKSLMGLQHPHIEPVVLAAHTESGCLVIRKFHKNGTLKDVLCMAGNPKNPFLSKYGNPKGRTALSMKQVATYGKQILEAMIFLHSKGYAYGHLHSGNVVIVDDCVKLLDIENQVLGVPAFYRPFFVQHSKIHTIETIDVYSFGHVIFEMAMGYPLQESIVVRQITECPEALKCLLESILSKEACKAGLPTLEQLIGHRFFTQYAATAPSDSGAVPEKPYFKLSLNAKELLKQAALRAENRLRDEQKSVKNQKRIVRVQELMSSEEEKRKSKHKAKLEHKQSKLKQQGSLQTNNGRLSLSAASSSTAAVSGLNTADSFNRSDSALTPEEPTLAGIKSPPLTPALHMATQTLQQTPFDVADLPASTSGGAASVERQSSTPNMSSEDTSEPTRSALLESICKFNRGSLRKVRSND